MGSSLRKDLPPGFSLQRALAVAALLAVGLAGCGEGSGASSSVPALLVVGARGDVPARPKLQAGVRVARNFARVYALAAYRSRSLPTSSVSRRVVAALVAAAARVPSSRRRLKPRLGSLLIQPIDATGLRATARIVDGHSPPFSIGFTLRRVAEGWQVTAISLPD
jgi:hypothetical protein